MDVPSPDPHEDPPMLLAQFDPPAFLDDFNAAQKSAWSAFISQNIDREIARNPGHHFYNPMTTETTADVVTTDPPIFWTAFPRLVQVNAPSDRARWTQADGSRDMQDEYCEWSVERDPTTHKITRVTFTSEGPEYWNTLGQVAPPRVLQLYQQFVNPAVKESDLFRNGRYNPRNRWNNSTTHGAMHLIQPNNTLMAEINIAVASSIVRRIDGQLLTDEQDLIACGQYGQPERFSDPHIGGEINKLARQQVAITIANPVALYIRDLSTAGWSAPDGSDPKQFWTIVRGTPQFGLRAVYEVPAGRGFVVGDITINGNPIEFGAQIADFITIKIIGQACRLGQNHVADATACVDAAPPAGVAQPNAAMIEAAVNAPTILRHR
jgi:hypothetical protein